MTKLIPPVSHIPSIKRRHVLTLRSLMHDCDQAIPKTDRSQIAEWERDLLATAACALWDLNLAKVQRCLMRLASSPSSRRTLWMDLHDAATYIFTGAWRKPSILYRISENPLTLVAA